MSSNEFIQDALTSHQIYLLRYAKQMSRDVMAEIEDALAIIEGEILTGGDTILRNANLVQIRNKINEIDNWEDAQGIIIKSSSDLATQEVTYLEALLLSATTKTGIVRTVHSSLFEKISRKKMLLRGASGKNQSLTVLQAAKAFTKKVQKDVIFAIQKGVSDGDGVATISRNVNNLVKDRTRREAEALTRTVTNFVASESRKVAANVNADILQGEKYTAKLDSRTTLFCMSYDGKILRLDESPFTPAHWNCRSLRVPVVKDKYKIPGLKGERPEITITEEGESKRGTVSSDTTYAGWLKRQPASFQDDVLGKERGKLLRSGLINVDNFVDSSGRTFTLKELAAADKKVADALSVKYGGNKSPEKK